MGGDGTDRMSAVLELDRSGVRPGGTDRALRTPEGPGGIDAHGGVSRWRAACYISCRDPAQGPRSLETQMRRTDAAVADRTAVVLARYVDSGSQVDNRGLGHALRRLEVDAAAGAFDVVVVEHLSRFAPDYATALLFAMELSRTGVRIVEACGGPVDFGALASGPMSGDRS